MLIYIGMLDYRGDGLQRYKSCLNIHITNYVKYTANRYVHDSSQEVRTRTKSHFCPFLAETRWVVHATHRCHTRVRHALLAGHGRAATAGLRHFRVTSFPDITQLLQARTEGVSNRTLHRTNWHTT